ncbi:signal recognition particle-docking protein FtsY [Balneatrix alpica]|uniref:signal recognition particle-docking protein FtsY n=1 Tax=Balneatrix alpica TaxID=75684 RepID=UPI0027397365|nr:signal recognition particle-docking protein FtsY [Balneatrix alpica]
MWDKLKSSLFGKKKPEPTPPATPVAPEQPVAEPSQEESALAPAQDSTVEIMPQAVETTVVAEPEQAEQPAPAAVEPLTEQPCPATEEEHPPVSLAQSAAEVAETEVAETAAAEAEQAPVSTPQPLVEPPVVAAAPVEAPREQEKPKGKLGFFERIKAGLSRTKANLTEGLASLFLGAKQIDDDLLEELETQLLLADVGMEATQDIIQRLTDRVSRKELKDPQALYHALKDELRALLQQAEQPLQLQAKSPYVILMVGVNGVGKTTTIGKLAKKYQGEGKKVMLAAGDTFRAAAVEQLQVWGERNQVPVIAQQSGADSAAVLFDALQAAKARGVDVLIADTAGRLQNKQHLMTELEKVVRVMKKLDPEAPHEVMLVLDAGTGQNAISQAKTFMEAVGVSGITLTKLDGTAKGGIIFAIAKQFGLPIRFIGVGEGIDDLRPFQANEFVDALFDRQDA